MSKEINFKLETTTVWSFPERGNWATHKPTYRGNWAPQIPRNLILRYSQEGELILDPMVGGGTTLVEAKLLNRNAIGLDINPNAIKLCKEVLNFDADNKSKQECCIGDARKLEKIEDESVDLVVTHPPYLNIIQYSEKEIEGDLSAINSLTKFCDQIDSVAKECLRVLKPGKYCAILMGDTRRRRHFVPLAFNVMQRFLRAGFILKEDIIKTQHNCATTRYWNAQQKDFLLIMHEHLFVFRKISPKENLNDFKDSLLR
ncbi:MAG: methyltransferase domain-containing protein [Candidatus Omnitrophica bacterium]|nr:methyltransferase domain-containing protein [Candidatus Omnitrophota bacterium]